MGLFAGEKIKKDKFIMEYTGKVVEKEGLKENMDQVLNDFRGRSYGFTVDNQTSLDAVYVGNLMWYANHAHEEYANCQIKMIFA